jgi:DNA-binding MarR family transcriptional regulator
MEVTSGQMCHDLFALLGRVKLAIVEVAEGYKLTPAQVGALYAVMHGDNTMGKVALTLHCDASNATGIVDRLVTHKLLVRQESEQDRRVKTLQLTDKGRSVIDEIIIKLPEAVGCNALDPKERDDMHTTICKLTQA